MSEYAVETKSGRNFVCCGATIEVAAQHAAERLQGRTAVVRRVTGDREFSGWFQPYKHDKRANALNSIGESFHIIEDL